MFSQYNPNSPTHQAYINYKIDYHNQPHDTIMVTPMPTLEKGNNSTLLNESDIDGINKQIEKTRKHVDDLNGMLKESSVPFTNDDFWCKYSPQIPLQKLIVEEIDEGDLPGLEAPFSEEVPLDRGSDPILEKIENHRSALNTSRSSLNKSALKNDPSYDNTDSFEIEGEGIYTGQHFDFIPNGAGTLTGYNGNVVTCNFVDGKANGAGSQIFKDGSMYKGTFVNGMKHGKGVLKTSSNKYKGEWRDDKKEGSGVLLYSNSESYEGEFSNNFPHGKGRYIFKDQSVYEGEFIEGKRHGLGALYYSDGVTVYEGTWERDRKFGQAKIILSNGIYEGSIVNDVKEGYGVYSYKNGDVYEGNWKQDKKHGEGIYYFANGGCFKGKWDYSKKHGRGIISTSDGTNYEEIWSMDKLISKKRLPIFLNPNLL
ncbi:predicted protein [Naegleria gruberi]|uniref:Predicted protein n=1 Tax=Naegleria gruberi TaxID=5762 RepID=D2VPR8_NAEGR|nr:uncharacterized protein NAEGRDRAFT_51291 [Naegleria gruberi]EFC41252.1 predicted protein [Naegleria gruberi]|eukprot:XP_002673996.1 predicted protein [Naegleria gruberi strain NEG-M]